MRKGRSGGKEGRNRLRKAEREDDGRRDAAKRLRTLVYDRKSMGTREGWSAAFATIHRSNPE